MAGHVCRMSSQQRKRVKNGFVPRRIAETSTDFAEKNANESAQVWMDWSLALVPTWQMQQTSMCGDFSEKKVLHHFITSTSQIFPGFQCPRSVKGFVARREGAPSTQLQETDAFRNGHRLNDFVLVICLFMSLFLMQRCVKSIPFYVEASKVFVTLAPSLRNAKGEVCNYSTYLTRGES